MELDNWCIGTGCYDKKSTSFSDVKIFNKESLKSFFDRAFDLEGRIKNCNETPILVSLSSNGHYTYIPLKRVIGNCVQDWNGKIYKLKDLDKFISKYTLSDKRIILDRKNPYGYQTLQGFSATGKNHRVNEDSHAYLTHPADDNIKLLVIADGMGGAAFGEKASRMIVDQMIGWFITTDPKLLEDSNWLYKNIYRVVCDRNEEIFQELVINQRIDTGTTFACAIINRNYMIHANVGDSRICILQDGSLKLVSIDDSPNWNIRETMTLEKLEIMRTLPNNNQITSHIGKSDVYPNIGYVPNKDYTDVFLFSDGVTDCISYTALNKIARNIDKKTLFEFIEQSTYGENTPGAKRKGTDDRTVIHYGKR
jgi:Serine/threonine protein phosphatase